MSIEATHYVMKTDIPDGIAKLVAFVIADYAHAETGQAWPEIETLARKCSQSVRTVQRKIRVLEELGILRIEQRHAETGRQRENLLILYLPGVPRPAANDPAPPRSSGRPARGEGDTQSSIPPPDPVTFRGIHQKGVPPGERLQTGRSPQRPLTQPRPLVGALPLPRPPCVLTVSSRRGATTRQPGQWASTPPSSG